MSRVAGERDDGKSRLTAVAHGRVQGVNYRLHVRRAAQQLGLTGWVANRWDGTVEAVAEGSRAHLLRFKEALERGSPSAYVDRVEASWSDSPSGEYNSFAIRY